jgi:hypothetical protein
MSMLVTIDSQSNTGCPDPADLRFQSPMVNDYNQDLCGGWTRDDIEDENAVIAERLANSLKPFGNLAELDLTPNAASELDAIACQLQEKGVRTRRYIRKLPSCALLVQNLDCCQPGTFGELFDLEVCM